MNGSIPAVNPPASDADLTGGRAAHSHHHNQHKKSSRACSGDSMGTITLRLFFAMLCAALVVLPFFLLYGREIRNAAESDQLLRFMPPQQAVNTGYISFRIKLLSVDLTQGRSDMMIYNIRPFGRYAAAPGSMFLARDTILFVNGNQVRLPADIPPGEQRITVQHAEGNVNHYPFDKHTLQLGFYAMTADELRASVRAASSGTNLGRSPFVPLGWTIASRSALSMTIESEGTPQLADLGVNDVTVAIRRHGAHKWFAITVVGVMWATSVVALANTVVVVLYRLDVNPTLFAVNALLLVALPIIRRAMPRVPAYGTLTDTLGLYWNITLVSLSMIVLTLFSFLKHRTEDRQRRARHARAAIDAHNMQKKQQRGEQKYQDPTAIATTTQGPPPQLPMIPNVMTPVSQTGAVGRAGMDPRMVPLPPSHMPSRIGADEFIMVGGSGNRSGLLGRPNPIRTQMSIPEDGFGQGQQQQQASVRTTPGLGQVPLSSAYVSPTPTQEHPGL